MLTYSRWQPDGGYDYYDVDGQIVALGNDLPVPRLAPVGGIGVPSVEAGRPVPGNARFSGTGELAKGVVAPTDVSRLGQALQDATGQSRLLWFAVGVATAGAVLLIARRI